MPNAVVPITKEIANFISNTHITDIPNEVISRGHVHLLDSLGVALVGTNTQVFEKILNYVKLKNAAGSSSIIGTNVTTSPGLAALANGTAMHAHNFDDTAPQPNPDRNGGIHAGAVVVPAALAASETTHKAGSLFSTAIHCGLEVACKLNHAISSQHYQKGYHTTASLGIFGAASATAKILNLSEKSISDTLAIATARAGGVRANFGTMTEQAHCGIAAESGIAAAEFAESGVTGAENIFETGYGWFAATGGGFEENAICGKLGNPWALVDPGTSIKPWPNGALTHPAMTVLTNLISEHHLNPDKIISLVVEVNEKILNTLKFNRPRNPNEARFSMPFALAALLVYGQLDISTFKNEFVFNTKILNMMDKIVFTCHRAAKPGYTNLTSLITIELTNGKKISGQADFSNGSRQSPMEWDDVYEKFERCARSVGYSRTQTQELGKAVITIESAPNLKRLTSALTR